MDHEIMRALRKEASNLGKATRGDWQQAIEKTLVSFAPDAIEAAELLDAFLSSLNTRYDRPQLADVEAEGKHLREALEELDRTTCQVGEEDEAYDLYRSRQECDGRT